MQSSPEAVTVKDQTSVEVLGQAKPDLTPKKISLTSNSVHTITPLSKKAHDFKVKLTLDEELAAKCQTHRDMAICAPESLVDKTILMFRPAFNFWRKGTVLLYKEGERKSSEEPFDISLESK